MGGSRDDGGGPTPEGAGIVIAEVCDQIGGRCYELIDEGALTALLIALSVVFHGALIWVPIWIENRRERKS